MMTEDLSKSFLQLFYDPLEIICKKLEELELFFY